MNSRSVHVVIVGAPRCGTTGLYDALAAHLVGIKGVGKDQYYLMDRESGLWDPERSVHTRGLDWYAAMVDSCPVTLEGVAGYLYQNTALEVLSQDLQANVFPIVVLRDPVERFISCFRYFSNNHASISLDIDEFTGKALRGELDHPDETIRDVLVQGRYELHIGKWLAAFKGREHPMTVVHLTDFQADPSAFLEQWGQQIGLQVRGPVNFARTNASISRRRSLPWIRARRFVGQVLGDERRSSVRRLLGRLERGDSGGSVPLRPDYLAELQEYYEPTMDWLKGVRNVG